MILVVEDNEMNMRLFCDILQVRGYETVRAYSGTAALELAAANKYQLIIMDMQLPDMSGLEVTRTIKENRLLNRVPILAVTAFAMKGDEEKILAGGCDAYTPKPIIVTEFLNLVERMISNSKVSSTSHNTHLQADETQLQGDETQRS
jgi:two-component system, cell cycle response regulator DivK